MAVWFILDVPAMTREQAGAVLKDLGLTDRPPPGQIFHIEGPGEGGGARVVDVWESEEAFNKFLQERLGPAFERAGVQMPPDVRPQFMPVWHVLK
jgi:hypothetical protein